MANHPHGICASPGILSRAPGPIAPPAHQVPVALHGLTVRRLVARFHRGAPCNGRPNFARMAPCCLLLVCSALLGHASGLGVSSRPPTSELLGRVSPIALAYLGDAVFEVAARERLLWPPSKMDALSSEVQRYACAEGQNELVQQVVAKFDLTEDEQDWMRRGRNQSGRGPRRLDPKVYRAATAFETLVGYLHLVDRARLECLFDFVFDEAVLGVADGETQDQG